MCYTQSFRAGPGLGYICVCLTSPPCVVFVYLFIPPPPLRRLEPGWNPNGLSDEQASLMLETHGPNIPVAERPLAALQILWGAIANPFNILLTILAVISAATKQISTFAVMMAMVFASTGLRFVDPVSVRDSLILPQILARIEVHDSSSRFDQVSHDEYPCSSLSNLWSGRARNRSAECGSR
jgi:hypothetical protein